MNTCQRIMSLGSKIHNKTNARLQQTRFSWIAFVLVCLASSPFSHAALTTNLPVIYSGYHDETDSPNDTSIAAGDYYVTVFFHTARGYGFFSATNMNLRFARIDSATLRFYRYYVDVLSPSSTLSVKVLDPGNVNFGSSGFYASVGAAPLGGTSSLGTTTGWKSCVLNTTALDALEDAVNERTGLLAIQLGFQADPYVITHIRGHSSTDKAYIELNYTPFQAINLTASDGTFPSFIRIDWDPPPQGGVAEYRIERSNSSTGPWSFVANTSNTYYDDPQSPGAALYYRVFCKKTASQTLFFNPAGPDRGQTPTVNSVVVSGPDDVSVNQSRQYTCSANFSNGQTVDVTDKATWDYYDWWYIVHEGNGLMTFSDDNLRQLGESSEVQIWASYGGRTSPTKYVDLWNSAQKAWNPFPSDQSTAEPITADLGWATPIDWNSTTYDVYFGTDSTPDSTEYRGNQPGKAYDPGALAYNTTYYWRIDTKNPVGIVTAGDVWRFTTREANSLAINPSSRSHTASAASGQSIGVSANISWTASESLAWVTITSGSSGSGNGTVTYSVAENTSMSSRSGEITVSGGGITRTFTVSQEGAGAVLSISPSSRSHAAAGASGQSIGVSANVSWTASESLAWVTITSGSSGSGNGTVAYSVAENASTSSRSGEITVSGGGITRIFTISQDGAGCTYSISPTSRSHTSGAGGGSIAVTAGSGCAWTATEGLSWVTITGGASGSGSGTVSYSVDANPAGSSARSGVITVAGQSFTVSQDGAGCTYSISPTSRSHTSGAGSGSIAVTAASGCAWTATEGLSWVTITGGASGSGSGTVSYSVDANPAGSSARSGVITVAGQSFTVSQDAGGCTYSISPTSRSHTSGAGSGSIAVTAGSGCAWTATEGLSWVTITGGASGSGSGTVSYSVDANPAGSSARSGVITVAGQSFTVSQDAGGSSQWIQNPANGHWYRLTSAAMTWNQTEVEAQSFGGHLVTINDPAENSWLVANFAQTEPRWIGLYQPTGSSEPNGGWIWTSGDPATYRNWYSGEPNNSGGTENVAELYSDSGKWNDATANSSVKYGIIEVKDDSEYIPRCDFDGDGAADVAVFRPNNGNWNILYGGGGSWTTAYGWSAVKPVPADYDGDGRADLSVYHPADGKWYIRQSSAGDRVESFGWSASIPLPGDYDGDGRADLAVFYQKTARWYLRLTSTGRDSSVGFGWSATIPVPADYDGDGATDLAVYYPAGAKWYVVESSTGNVVEKSRGGGRTLPVPADYDGDGKADAAVFYQGRWIITLSSSGMDRVSDFGWSGTLPVPADYDGDGKADLAVYHPAGGKWYVLSSETGATLVKTLGSSDRQPVLLNSLIHSWFKMY